jgi:hypothetical protein
MLLEFVRWNNNDDAITNDPLCMRITNLTKLNLTQPNLTFHKRYAFVRI